MKTLSDCKVGDLVWLVNLNSAKRVQVFSIKRKYIEVCQASQPLRPLGRPYNKDSGWEKGYETVGGWVGRLMTDDQHAYASCLTAAHNGIWAFGFSKHVGTKIPDDKIVRIYEAMKAIMEEK